MNLLLVVSTLHLHVKTSPMGSKTPLGHQFCRLPRICLTLLSLMAQRVGGAKKPFVLGRHNNAEKRKQRGSWDVWEGGAISAKEHQRIPQQMSPNKMAARSAQSITLVIRTGWCLCGTLWSLNLLCAFLTQRAVVFFLDLWTFSVRFVCFLTRWIEYLCLLIIQNAKEEYFYCELLVN